MRFPYYERLSRAEREIYRRSDALTEVRLPRARWMRDTLIPPIADALARDQRKEVEQATALLVAATLDDLGAPPVKTLVLAKRPKDDDGGELHGLYVAEDGKTPLLRVWMRTAAKKQPVALRTFVRTVMHEAAHHLDFTIFGLDPSFHCEGFFKREAHLARQLLDDPAARLFPKGRPRAPTPEPEPQLDLFDRR